MKIYFNNKIVFILLIVICQFVNVDEIRAQNYSDHITVNLFMLHDCVICRSMSIEINELYEAFNSDEIEFIAYFPNLSSKPIKIEEFKEDFNINVPSKTDYFKSKALALNATVCPMVVVYDEINKSILYHGRIDDSFASIGKRRRVITNSDLRNALESIVANEEIRVPKTEAIGCFINFKELE